MTDLDRDEAKPSRGLDLTETRHGRVEVRSRPGRVLASDPVLDQAWPGLGLWPWPYQSLYKVDRGLTVRTASSLDSSVLYTDMGQARGVTLGWLSGYILRRV